MPFAVMIFRRQPRAAAVSIIFLAGTAFLPEQAAIDLPAIPPIDKEYLTYLTALVLAMVYYPRHVSAARPGRGVEAIIALLFIGNFASALINPNAMMDEGKLEPGLGIYDVIARTGDDVLGIGVPYFVGRAMFTSKEDLRVLLTMLGAVGLIYTVLITIEVAMSIPFHVFQLGQRVYGIGVQPLWRWGVIQPVVFMDNGLAVATFTGACLLAVAGLLKARLNVFRVSAKRARIVLIFGLLMTRNVAGNVYGLVLTPCIALFKPRIVGAIAVGLVTFSCVYPALRTADVFPDEALVEFARGYDKARARSLWGRFEEEDFVLGKLGDRFWFGWGNYTRIPGAETFGEGETGLDGWWINRIGTNGLVGVELQYAFFALPVFLAWRRSRKLRDPAFAALLSALMAIVGMRSIDLLLNGWWNSLPIFLAGALSGVSGSLGRRRTPMRRDPQNGPTVGVEEGNGRVRA